jgi:hypothetical protein
MNFLIIRPERRTIEPIEAKEPYEVYPAAGLDRLKVDHGMVYRPHDGKPGVSLVVHETGMFVPPAEQHYFAIGTKLYAGNAVAYGFDEGGDTVDLPLDQMPRVDWFESHYAVEDAIRNGAIERPRLAVNGVVKWQWPERYHEGV